MVDVPSIMLDTQYRMHPSLAAFSSKTFYSSLLKNGTPASERPPPETAFLIPEDPIPDPSTGELRLSGEKTNLTFLNHSHLESPVLQSMANEGEAEIIVDVVTDLLHKNPVSATESNIVTTLTDGI